MNLYNYFRYDNLENIQYDVNTVVDRLSAKIVNLEMQLAFEQAINETYAKRIEELEKKVKGKEDKNAE